MSGRYDIVFSKDFADDLRGIGGYVERVSGSPETSRRRAPKAYQLAMNTHPSRRTS